ncbi:hypothetical protein LTR78_004056 [Recurvomyces mirabilis]|uniref:CST complex subunit STN1 n=1 Tax=Recurvomyces mirabilis TaxID=574656 RepID=A0AAE0WQC2_9PEZI|nr:hypothetical protein LTR78_004056 [Recurvomyces mirabilis]KAK5153770.1 hypothetical protein LTS14_007464 [Recurvomyces mirabilis]
MSSRARYHVIHPKRYWDESTTWKNWNKLTAADIHHTLRTEPGFEGQNVFFYGNNPIQFVRVVGLLVDLEQRGRYTILSIDDSSGACVDVKIERRHVKAGDEAEYPTNTTIDNVHVKIELALPTLFLNAKPVDMGTVLEVKGTVSVFRNTRQIDLARLFRVKDTNAEAAAWIKTAQWKMDALSQAWILSNEQRRRVDEKVREAERQERERTRKRREWRAKRGDKRRDHEEKKEAKRKRSEVQYNTGALYGSHLLPHPWD